MPAGATLKILREALDLWDATEAEGQQRGAMAPAVAATPSSGDARASALAFVAAFVTAGRATVQLRDAVPILECLAQVCRVLVFLRPPKCNMLQGTSHIFMLYIPYFAAMQPVRERLEAALVPMQDAGSVSEEARSSREQSFAAVLLSAVGARSEPSAEADCVLRRALQLARAAGFLQPQAQVSSPARLGLPQPALVLCTDSFAWQSRQGPIPISQPAMPAADGHKALVSANANPYGQISAALLS